MKINSDGLGYVYCYEEKESRSTPGIIDQYYIRVDSHRCQRRAMPRSFKSYGATQLVTATFV